MRYVDISQSVITFTRPAPVSAGVLPPDHMAAEHKHKWLTLVAMTGSLSMIFVDQTVVSVALPRIQTDLGMSQSGLQWIINAYVLSLAATVALGGRLGDRFGRVRAFVTGVILFAFASAACGLAPNEAVIIASRAFQGVAASLMVPSSAAIVIESFDIRERGKAMAIYVGVAQAFLAVGPLLGGFLTEFLSWRWVFWINLPVGALALFMTYVSKPADIIPDNGRVRLRYAALLMAGMFSFVFGIQQGHDWGWISPITLGLVTGGFLLLAFFAYTQIKTENPLIQMRLFKNPAFSADAVLMFCIQFAMISIIVFGAIYLQKILGFTPLHAGFALMPIIFAVVIMSQISGRIFDRVGVRLPALVGTFLIAVGFFSQAPFLARADFMWILPGMILLGFGIGFVMVPTNTDALNRAPSEYRGQASGVMQTVRQMGATVGLACIGGLVATLEGWEVSGIMGAYGDFPGGKDRLAGLIRSALEGQPGAVNELSSVSPGLIGDLNVSVSKSIAAGYYFAGGVVVAAFFIALFFMRSGRQKEDA
ncbi:MAG: DHA2 family efflux MFS transporter permease subunit [Deltaproteobacteria bacterium]